MTDGDFLLGETSRRETVAWLVRFIGWALFASLGAGIVVGVLAAAAQAPAGVAIGAGLVASLLTVALMCVASSGPMPSELDEHAEDYVAR